MVFTSFWRDAVLALLTYLHSNVIKIFSKKKNPEKLVRARSWALLVEEKIRLPSYHV